MKCAGCTDRIKDILKNEFNLKDVLSLTFKYKLLNSIIGLSKLCNGHSDNTIK